MKIYSIINLFYTYLKFIFTSNQCLVCYKNDNFKESGLRSFLCTNCAEKINPVFSFTIKINNKQYLLNSIGSYDGVLKRLISKKYTKNPIPFIKLGRELAFLMQSLKKTDFDYIIPIPLHKLKRGYRWFNQSEEIARSISQSLNIPLFLKLERIRNTKSQAATKNLEERKQNILDAFILTDKKSLEGKKVLLVDDVYTSGATIKEAIIVINQSCPAVIEVATLARAI